MKNLKTKIIISMICFFSLCMLSIVVNATSNFDMKSIDFKANLLSNGDMQIEETWNIHIYGNTNTLFTNKEIKGITGITDPKVEYIKSDGSIVELKKIDQYMEHVDTDCYYGLNIEKNKYEIAWGVNTNKGNRTYKIYYTIKNCVNVYNDCSDVAWKIMNNYKGAKIPEIHGIINIPNEVLKKDNLRVWMHCNDEGEIHIIDNKSVEFNIKNYRSDYAEFRIVTLDKVFPDVKDFKINNKDKLNEILNYEQDLANKSNLERENRAKEKQRKAITLFIVILSINVIYFILVIRKKNILINTKKLVPTENIKYFRELPRNDATPAQAILLKQNNIELIKNNIAKVVSATMLDLSLKGYISFDMKSKFLKDNIIIKLLNKENIEQLKESEKVVYNYILDVYNKYGDKEKNTIRMKDFEDYAELRPSKVKDMSDKIIDSAIAEQELLNNYDKKSYDKGSKYSVVGVLGIFILIINIIILLCNASKNVIILASIVGISIIPLIYSIIMTFKISSRFTGLTQCGVDEKAKWDGLEAYMKDFSLLKEKNIPDLIIWEKFLVYATVFGISNKVIKELRKIYPQMTDDNYLKDTYYLYLMNNNNFNSDFIGELNKSVNMAYTNSISTSGAGYGGGSSSGGGFNGGGGSCGGR